MANTSREQLKAWFRRGMKPLQSQFAAWIDSFWHKDDSIPMASIEGLADALNSITVPVDDTISAESENPVQNKVIKEALDGKAATVHYHNEYAGYGDIEDLQAQIDLLAQREPSAREVITVATADDLDDIEEPSTEVIYKTLDESKLYLYDGERFNDVTGRAVDNTIYVNNTGALLSITLDDGVYSVMCTSATPHTYSLSVTGDSRILADKDGWAARVLSSGSYVWQWHRYSYEGHTHTIAEITDLPDIADSIVLALNPNTYEITATIKKGNTTIATSAAIDLPLETMVVGGSYDDQTKKVVLTLKNGQTVEFSVADLVSGLAAENHTHSINDITDYTPPTITVDSALDETSENPVQNKVVKTALDAKAASSHTHSMADITDYSPDGQFTVWLNEALECKTVPNALGAFTISEIDCFNISTLYYSLSSGAEHQQLTLTNGKATGLTIVVPAGGWIRFEDAGRTVYNSEAAIGVKYAFNS